MSLPERLDLITFERLLGIHGSRVERWPDAYREPLARLLDSSAEAQARWEEARALERVLDALPAIEPTPALMARIASLPARHPRPERRRWWPFHGALTPLLGWGVAALLGVTLGAVEPPEVEDVDLDADAADIAALELDDDAGDDWSDVSDLVTGGWAAEEE
ncbi:MAG TPA: hypothetical protein VNN80_20880 [Polyangiaceae bacterium]|jgi:hypothetical protein|nr:hypothetical protein [Polyangiaceae bacterium]